MNNSIIASSKKILHDLDVQYSSYITSDEEEQQVMYDMYSEKVNGLMMIMNGLYETESVGNIGLLQEEYVDLFKPMTIVEYEGCLYPVHFNKYENHKVTLDIFKGSNDKIMILPKYIIDNGYKLYEITLAKDKFDIFYNIVETELSNNVVLWDDKLVDIDCITINFDNVYGVYKVYQFRQGFIVGSLQTLIANLINISDDKYYIKDRKENKIYAYICNKVNGLNYLHDSKMIADLNGLSDVQVNTVIDTLKI